LYEDDNTGYGNVNRNNNFDRNHNLDNDNNCDDTYDNIGGSDRTGIWWQINCNRLSNITVTGKF
jgi:hypothetical protein